MKMIHMSKIVVVPSSFGEYDNKEKSLDHGRIAIETGMIELAVALFPAAFFLIYTLIKQSTQAQQIDFLAFFKEGDFIWVAATYAVLALVQYIYAFKGLNAPRRFFVASVFFVALIMSALYIIIKIEMNHGTCDIDERSMFILQATFFVLSAVIYLVSKTSAFKVRENE